MLSGRESRFPDRGRKLNEKCNQSWRYVEKVDSPIGDENRFPLPESILLLRVEKVDSPIGDENGQCLLQIS